MEMMQVAVDQIIHVVAVRDRFVPASLAMPMPAFVGATVMIRRAFSRVGLIDIESVFVEVIRVGVVEMTVVQVVDMVAVADGRMATAFAVRVCVVRMLAAGHGISPRGI